MNIWINNIKNDLLCLGEFMQGDNSGMFHNMCLRVASSSL